MNQNLLLKASFIISLLGIFFLLFLTSKEPSLISISEITSSLIDKQVKISGTITSTEKLSENFYLIKIKDETGSIEATLNKDFQTNKTIEISGKVTEYKNKTQIQADKTTIIT